MKDQERAEGGSTRKVEEMDPLEGFLRVCAWCNRVRDDQGYWMKARDYIEKRPGILFTHGICPQCLKEHSPDTYERIEEDGGKEYC